MRRPSSGLISSRAIDTNNLFRILQLQSLESTCCRMLLQLLSERCQMGGSSRNAGRCTAASGSHLADICCRKRTQSAIDMNRPRGSRRWFYQGCSDRFLQRTTLTSWPQSRWKAAIPTGVALRAGGSGARAQAAPCPHGSRRSLHREIFDRLGIECK